VVPEEIFGVLSSAIDVGREANAASVGRLVLTHLMPKTDDADAVAAAAERYAGPIDVARPGQVIEVSRLG
jgi:ribonuclease BN (tRNA processing enzyme)